MDKITFVNNQEPALNATNLNQIQSNIETAISNIINLIASEWKDNVSYSLGSDVIYNGVLYSAKVTSTTKGEFIESEWLSQSSLITKLTQIQNDNIYNLFAIAHISGASIFIYDNSKTYKVGDYCFYNVASGGTEYNLFRCTTEIPTAENWNSKHWEETDFITELHRIMNLNDDGSIDTSKLYYIDPATYQIMGNLGDGTFENVFVEG